MPRPVTNTWHLVRSTSSSATSVIRGRRPRSAFTTDLCRRNLLQATSRLYSQNPVSLRDPVHEIHDSKNLPPVTKANFTQFQTVLSKFLANKNVFLQHAQDVRPQHVSLICLTVISFQFCTVCIDLTPFLVNETSLGVHIFRLQLYTGLIGN